MLGVIIPARAAGWYPNSEPSTLDIPQCIKLPKISNMAPDSLQDIIARPEEVESGLFVWSKGLAGLLTTLNYPFN